MIPIFFYLTDQSTVVSKDCSYYKKVIYPSVYISIAYLEEEEEAAQDL